MESMGSSNRPSAARKSSVKTGKPKRRYVSRSKSEQGSDTPQHENFPIHPSIAGLSREERIKLYMERLWVNPGDSKCKKLKDTGGNPVNVFTGELYKDDEIKGVEMDDDKEWLKDYQ